jgi:outer membrane receptor protein involved in Fe transport
MRILLRKTTPNLAMRARRVKTITVIALLATSVDGARAQDAEEPPEAIETIEVVGSHIRGIDAQGLSPVLVLDRPTIERTGAISVAEVLQELPMNNAGTFDDRDALSAALGGTGISFRGMGANSVLVLINGRRATTYGFSNVTSFGSHVSFVDLNNIPIATVERIEILKDGASALYGSEAMTGVVNIVLRRNFVGTEFGIQLGAAADGRAEEQSLNALFGWEMPRTHVEVIASYAKREQLSWRDRSISASANHADQGGLDQRSLVAGSLGDECEERNATHGVSGYQEVLGTGVCLFDPNTEIVVPSVERVGLLALVSHELTPDITLHIEASALASETKGRRDSVPWSGGVFPAGNPWNPFGQDVLTDYRFSESGSRTDVIEIDNHRAVLVLEGELGKWDWDLAALHHGATTESHGEGYLSADRIEQALNGIDLNGDGLLQPDEYLNLYSPASNSNSLALTSSLGVSTFRRSVTKLTSYTLKMARDLLRLPAGNVSVVLGLEQRTDSLDDDSDSLSLSSHLLATTISRELLGYGVGIPRDLIDPYAHIDPVDFPVGPLEPTGAPSTHGRLSQDALFGELRIPLLAGLDLQAALRYDVIRDFGEDLSPKLALRHEVTQRVRTRASWSRSFRAPSPGEMYLGPSAKLQASWDPKRCPAYPGWVIPEIAGGCVVSQFVTTTWGNPELTSEKSESVSIGIEVDISKNHDASMDCWKIDVDNKIFTPPTAWFIRHEDELPPGTVIRDPLESWDITDPDMNNTHGVIAQINVLSLNFGSQETEGCDVEFNSTWERGVAGTFRAQFLATHMASNKLAFDKNGPFEELAGTYGYPKNRANLNLYWNTNEWQVGLVGRWTDGFADTVPDRAVASHTEWDMQIGYSGLKSATFALGIENLFDTAPPSSVGNLHPQGFPVQFYRMRGRFIYLRATF